MPWDQDEPEWVSVGVTILVMAVIAAVFLFIVSVYGVS